MINFKPIFRFIGVLLVMIGFLMLTGLPFAHYFQSGDGMALIKSAAVCIAAGLPLFFFTPKSERKDIKKREGYLIVALGWFSMVIFGMLPYLFSAWLTES